MVRTLALLIGKVRNVETFDFLEEIFLVKAKKYIMNFSGNRQLKLKSIPDLKSPI